MNSHGGIRISFITVDRFAEESKTRKEKKTLLSDARKLSDDELLAKLKSLGIAAGKQWLRELCERYRSAEELSRVLCAQHDIKDFDSDWVWFCATILWERWFPDVPNLEMIDDTMQLGYQRLARKDVAGACDAWLSYWRAVVKLMEKWKIETVSEFDEQFLQTQGLFNWCQDFEMELGNAALGDAKYRAARLQFCRQIIPLVDPEERLLRENMRRAIAESCFDMGERQEADKLYEQWLAADPGWGWGWIGWSDLYWLFSHRGRDYQTGEQILTRAIKIPGLRDRADVLERLSDMYEQSGQEEKRRKVAAQLDSLRPQSHKSRTIFQAATATSEPPPYLAAESNTSPVSGEGRKKIGRNEPCPCGSGKKYKRCCGG